MGWFAAAAILGFGAFFWIRHRNDLHFGLWDDVHGERLQRIWPGQHWRWILVGSLLAVTVLLWALLTADVWWSLRQVVDRLGSGYIARFLLGFVLGVGAGYVLEQRHADLQAARETQRKKRRSRAKGWGVADWSAALSGATALVLLAVFAPALDSWLPRITSLKTAVIEFQVRGEATHQIAVADNLETSSSVFVLRRLSEYASRIHDDIDYLELVEVPTLKSNQTAQLDGRLSNTYSRLSDAKKVVNVFDNLISPGAKCLYDLAIEDGVSIERLRTGFRSTADLLEQIIFSYKYDTPDGQENKRRRFWSGLLQYIDKMADLNMKDHQHCVGLKVRYVSQKIPDEIAYPRIVDYPSVPYLYVAAAAFMHFLQDDDIALRILKEKAGYNNFRL